MFDRLEENIDYLVLEPLEENLPSPIKILADPYGEVIVMYGKVRIEEPLFGPPRMAFTYQILETGDYWTKEELESSSDFKNFLGDLIRDMIIDANEIRTSNTEKSKQ